MSYTTFSENALDPLSSDDERKMERKALTNELRRLVLVKGSLLGRPTRYDRVVGIKTLGLCGV